MSTEESLLTPELLALVDRETPPREVVVAAETVRRVRETLADPSPGLRDDLAPPYVLLAFEAPFPVPELPHVPESLVTGDEWTLRRPLRIGERLHMSGRLVAAHERLGGRFGHTLSLRAAWTLRDASGTPVAELGQSLIRYRTPVTADAAAASAPEPPREPAERWPAAPLAPAEGVPLPEAVLRPTLDRVVRYCGLTWNFVPIFYDPAAAYRAGLPGTIVPGPLKLALLTRYLQLLAGPAGSVSAVRCVYRRPDRTGAPLAVRGVVTRVVEEGERRRVECELWTETTAGERSVSGFAVLVLPSVL